MMKLLTSPLALLSISLLVSFVSSREDNYLGRTTCYRAFALAGFDIYDFDSYPNYFNDESVMQLAQAGTYHGAAGIEEYVRFASPTSPYIEALKSYDKNAKVKTATDPQTGECVMTVVVTSAAKYSSVVQNDRATTRTAMLKLYFEPTSFSTISISTIYVYYELPYLNYFFGELTNTDQTREFVCTTMRDNCADVWAANGLSSLEDCMTELAALPVAEENADVSGNTQGCRVLHAAFASINELHCPHISFLEMVDDNGKIKCQTSSFRPVSEMFDDEDMEVFDERRAKMGLDNDMAAEVCNCLEEGMEQQSSWLDRLIAFYNGLLSIGPLPETWSIGTPPYCEICNQGD